MLTWSSPLGALDVMSVTKLQILNTEEGKGLRLKTSGDFFLYCQAGDSEVTLGLDV